VSYGSPQTLSGDTLPLTMGQRAQARSNIAAASFDALAYNGMQFNGSFEVSQERGPGTGVVLGASATTYICDGWTGYVGASGPAVTGQVTPVAGVVLGNVLVVNVTTAKPSLVAADLVCVSHPIEGYRVGRLNFGYSSAQPVTIGFWSGHHRPGAYCGSLTNGAGNRSYVFTYTHNVADGFQFNVVTIPGDITGTWAKDNTKGLQVTFTMAAGSAYQAAAANAWSAGNFYAVAPQVNGVAATTDVFRIYGVIVLPGLEAPSAARAPLIMRPYEQELLVCQRQLYVFQPGDGVTLYARNAQGDSYRCVSGHFPCQMRAAPTVTGTGLLNYAGGQLAATCAAYLNSWTVSYPGTLASDIFVIQNFKADARL
jgi:hypothetical protein